MARVLLGGLLTLVIAMGIGRFAYAPILPAMQSATGLGGDGAGLLASLNYLGYFLGAAAASWVPHGAVRTWTFRAALVASVATTAGMGVTDDFFLWSVLRFLSGLASAGMFILGIAMVLDALVRMGAESRAGWMYMGVGAGIAGSGLFVALFGGRLGWDGDWLALGAVCVPMAVPVWLWVQDHAPKHAATAAAVTGGLSAPLLLLTAAYFLEGAGYIVTGTFLVALLKRMPDTAAIGEAAWTVAGLAAVPSGLFWAAMGRKLGGWRALILAHLAQAVGIVLPLAGLGAVGGFASAVLFGGTFVGIVSMAFMLGRQLSGGASAKVVGALTAAYGLGQILGPLPAGIAVERTGSFAAALMGASGVVALGAACLLGGLLLSRPAPSPGASPASSGRASAEKAG
ncbi:YbfB/YjiJ family MFS transporter [Azospirillum sp.]|uniref:YbfB/YjiJ family MFS transporter n=1 Tax=Azospirillum sp. TaxID=34012 RepID=UPI003D70CD5A